MEDVVIVSGARTAIGRFQGGFSNTPASDLGAAVIKAAVERAGLKPEQVDHVIMGCVGQVMEDGYLSRHASVKAGMPVETPALTVNRICGSGLEAINTAARYIETGDADDRRGRRRGEHDDDAVLRAAGPRGVPHGRRDARGRHPAPAAATPSTRCTWASRPRTWPSSTRSRARRRTSTRCARRSGRPRPIAAGQVRGRDRAGRGEAGEGDGGHRQG